MDLHVDERVWLDATTIAAGYEEHRPGLGEEFLAAVVEAIGRIARHPEAWRKWPGARERREPLHRYVMARFPYSIGYQRRGDTIVVIVIAHGRRLPP